MFSVIPVLSFLETAKDFHELRRGHDVCPGNLPLRLAADPRGVGKVVITGVVRAAPQGSSPLLPLLLVIQLLSEYALIANYQTMCS